MICSSTSLIKEPLPGLKQGLVDSNLVILVIINQLVKVSGRQGSFLDQDTDLFWQRGWFYRFAPLWRSSAEYF